MANMSRLIATVVGTIGAFVIAAMMVHITADVVARYFFGTPLVGTLEIVSRYYMVAVTFLPLAWIELRNQMICVSVFDTLLSPHLIRIRDLIVALITLCTIGLLGWTSWLEAAEAIERKAFVMALGERVPVWPTYLLLPIGFCLVGIILLIRIGLILSSDKNTDEIGQGVLK